MEKPRIKKESLSRKNSNPDNEFQNSNLESILDSTNARIWTVDKKYCLVFGNSTYHEEFRKAHNRDIETGETVLIAELSEKDRKEIKSYYKRALLGEKFSVEHRRTYSNTEKWNIYHFGPLLNKSGKRIGASVVAHDITEKIIARETIKNSAKRFEELVELLPEAIFEMNLNFNLTYANQYALNLFGYSQNDFDNGINSLDILVPEHREIAKQNFQKRIIGINPGTIEYKAQKKDGTIFPIHFHANAILIDGKLNGIRGVIVDLTERKQVEEKLREYKEMFSLFMKHSPIYTFIKDVTPDQSRVLQASDNYNEMIGVSGNEMIGKTMEELFPPDFAAKITADDWNVVNEGKVLQLDENLNNRHYTTIKFPIISGNKKLLAGYTIDITDRKLADEEHKRMALMLDLAPDSIVIHDFAGNILFANKKTFELYGYSEKEFSKFSLDDLCTPETKKLIPEKMNQIKKMGHFTFQVEHFRKDGTIFPLEVSATTTKWDNKDVIISVGSDITERINHENALKESEEKFKNIFSNSVVGISVTEINGKLNGNKAFSQITGYSIQELNATHWEKITHPEDIDKNHEILNSILTGKTQSVRWEKRYIHKNGNIVWVDISTTLQKDNKKEDPLYFITSIIDITRKKQVEEKLIESEERFRSLYENSTIGLYRTSPDGEILMANPALAKMLLFDSPEELCKRNLETEGFKQSYERKEFIERIEKERVVLGKESIWSRKDNTPIYVRESARAISDTNGKTLYYDGTVENITERKEAEKELLANQTFLKETQKIANLGTYQMDISSGIWKSSEILDNIFGIDNDFVKNVDGWLSLIHPKWRNELQDHLLNEVIGKNGDFDKEYKIVRLIDGKERWLHGLGRLDFNKLGQPVKMIGTIQDITEIKLIQEELLLAIDKAEKNERKYKLILNTLTEGVSLNEIVYNENHEMVDYKIIEINEAFKEVADYTTNEIIGNVATKLYGISSDYIKTFWHEHKTRNETTYTEMQSPITKKYSYIATSPFVNDRFVTSFFDITELKFAEKELKKKTVEIESQNKVYKQVNEELIKAKQKVEEAETQLLAILENSPTGFAINTISTGKVKYVNKAFSEIYHIPPELCKNVETFIEYVYGEQMELGKKIISDVESGDTKRMKWNMIPVTDKNTNKKHYVSAANIILKDFDLMISSAWDVTSQVEYEEKLISALNKATESDRLKSAFLANMSHEIRTPMNGILGFTSLLKEPQLTGKEQKKYIDIIEKSGERMLNTINDIIDISRIESGQVVINISETNVIELIDHTLSFFKPEADKKAIKLLTANKLHESDVIIKSDKEKINAVLTNLIKNALKFCEKGSIVIGCSQKDNFVEFYVKDTGKGIPPERLDAIFERFVQADIEDKEVKEGSGLGLAISKSYIEMLGGKIWVKSEKDKGSTFFFTIPFIQAEAVNNHQNKNNENTNDKMKKLNILIAEDDEVSEMLTKIMIGKSSNNIFIAKTGTETVEICKNNADIDLILMDIKMPLMDGYNATRKIREFNKDVIIIATTAFALTGDREKALDAGCNNYLTKPLSQNQLDELIDFYFKK